MARNVAADLAAVLEASGLDLTRPPDGLKNLYLGPLPEDDDDQVPDLAVAILMTGGVAPQPYMGSDKSAFLQVTCQIIVRAGREDFSAGQTLALGVYDALNLATASPYTAIRVRESAPYYLKTDSSDRHQWTLNVEAEYAHAWSGVGIPGESAYVVSFPAEDVTVTPTGNLSADDAQEAFEELQGDIDTINASSHAALTLAAAGSTPNANAASLSAQALTLQPADGTYPGIVSTIAQTFAGLKTFVAGIALQAKLAITGVSSGENAIEVPDGSEVEWLPSAVNLKGTTEIPLRKNVLVRSQELDAVAWSVEVGALIPTRTANAAVAPDATTTAEQLDIKALTGSGQSIVYQGFAATAENWSASIYLRTVTGTATVYVSFTPNGSVFHTTACSVTTTWQRFTITNKLLTGTTWYFTIGHDSRDTANQSSTQPAKSIYAWGAQVEKGPTVSDYIATTTATVIRSPSGGGQASGQFLATDLITTTGDLVALTAEKGLVLKSPNGTWFRVTVSNAGALTVAAL